MSAIRHWWARVGELALGFSANTVVVYGFDYLLYPVVIYQLGLLSGSAVMALLSFVICLLTLRFYDWSKRDWLGIEAVKGLKEYSGPSRWRRWTSRALQRGDGLALVLLSLKFDPFITTLYLRHGAFNGLSARDWRHFLASWFIGNAYWTFLCFGGVELFRWLKALFWP